MTDMLAGREHDLEFTNFLKKYGKERFDLLYPDFYDVNDPVIPAERDWSDWEVEVPEVPEGDFPLEYTASTMTKAKASRRSLVVIVSGRKMAKNSAFHTHSHLSSASTGKSALPVVHQQ